MTIIIFYLTGFLTLKTLKSADFLICTKILFSPWILLSLNPFSIFSLKLIFSVKMQHSSWPIKTYSTYQILFNQSRRIWSNKTYLTNKVYLTHLNLFDPSKHTWPIINYLIYLNLPDQTYLKSKNSLKPTRS